MPNVVVRPSEIRFLHDSIDCRFQNGDLLLDTFESLLYGRITVDDIKTIAVISLHGKWYIYAGHRRLYLYKQLESLSVIGVIKVWRVDRSRIQWDGVKKKLTTDNEGLAVEVRNDPYFDIKMQKIIRKWKSTIKVTVQGERRHYRPTSTVRIPTPQRDEYRSSWYTTQENRATKQPEAAGWFDNWCAIL
ncbi:uncharacterized protein LOC144445069 [Glandiceps talaboti]